MAKQLIVHCDAAFTLKPRECTDTHEDTRTFTISIDGDSWEVDLGGPHAEALVSLARRGRPLTAPTTDIRSLDRRVRNVPAME